MPSKLLKEYNAKRDFTKTKEPKGASVSKRDKGLSFVVQKHAARRLHWDFRLEQDGVLKSWAVTNEPVADPAIKRLAVRTEDHPLSYGSFKGDIPKGHYGGGHVDIWDNGTWEPLEDPKKGLKAGKLHFALHGKRMRGAWTLVRMHPRKKEKRENWLLIKSNDDAVEKVALSIPKAVLRGSHKKSRIVYKPALALRVDEPPEGDGWLHELKYDGYRALLNIDKGAATIVTRNGLDWTERFPSIVAAASKLKVKSAAIDGEIVVFDKNGHSDFGYLQQTLAGEADYPMTFMAFDLLKLDGKSLEKKSLLDRKAALQKLLKGRKSAIQYSDHVIGNGAKFFKQAGTLKAEGIISKKVGAAYHAGRGGDWLKIKLIEEEEFVIGGWLPRSDNAKRVGAILLGQINDGKLIYTGKVGTGFNEVFSDRLMKQFKKLAVNKTPFNDGPAPQKNAQWVRPKLVAMIEYTERTSDGLVRHGVYKGLREDKPAGEVHEEEVAPVAVVSEKLTQAGGISITHPDRIVYPESGYTKQHVADYYAAMADRIMPFIAKRPISVMRCPDGLKTKCFFQRHIEGKAAELLTQLPICDETSREAYVSADTAKALVSLVQYGVIEIHAWGSKAPAFTKPDQLVFDLDPDPKIDWPSVKAATLLVKKRLEKLKLKTFLKATGGKGLHVVVPVTPKYEWDKVKQFCHELVDRLAEDYPDAFTTNPRKERRKGKIFLDYLRNEYGSTSVIPYGLRARAGAPIALPLAWSELARLKAPNYYNLKNVAAYLKKRKSDPWAAFIKSRQPLRL